MEPHGKILFAGEYTNKVTINNNDYNEITITSVDFVCIPLTHELVPPWLGRGVCRVSYEDIG